MISQSPPAPAAAPTVAAPAPTTPPTTPRRGTINDKRRRPAFLRFAPEAIPSADTLALAEPSTPPMHVLPPAPEPSAPRAKRMRQPVSPVSLLDGNFDTPPVSRRLLFPDEPHQHHQNEQQQQSENGVMRDLIALRNLKM